MWTEYYYEVAYKYNTSYCSGYVVAHKQTIIKPKIIHS